MIPLNCLIVDDSNCDRLTMEDYVQECNALKLTGSYSNPLDAISAIKSQPVDLLFLDIDMPVMNGITFFKTLTRPPLCIFVTSHPDYAVDAFDIHAFDYLLKPVKKERFDKAIERVKELFDIRERALQYNMNLKDGILTVKEGNSINKVQINDIIYLEALTNYTKVVTGNRTYITLNNLKNFLEELPEEKFLRVHRSFAVAKNKISQLNGAELVAGSHKVPVGKTYRQNIHKILAAKTV
jgi:DNA-binding LytR/AlgR family response regulator